MPGLQALKTEAHGAHETSRHSVEWHHECLILTLILASGFSAGKLRKLLLAHGEINPQRIMNPGELLETAHHACHRNQDLVNAISKDLILRFKNNLTRIAATPASEVAESVSVDSWLFPPLWACYQQKDSAYAEAGRALAHAMLWQAVKAREKSAPDKAQAAQIERLCGQNQELTATVRKLRKDLTSARKALKKSATQAAKAGSAPATDAAGLRRKLKSLKHKLNEEQNKSAAFEKELAAWRSMALNLGEKGKGKIGRSTQAAARGGMPPCPQINDRPDCCAHCPAADTLKGRKVAVIGGLDSLEGQYREVISKLGGEGVCHNGKLRNGCRKLRQLVNRSDLVVFITPINSHGALHMVKTECKKCTTPFCVMKSAGASSLEDLLVSYAT